MMEACNSLGRNDEGGGARSHNLRIKSRLVVSALIQLRARQVLVGQEESPRRTLTERNLPDKFPDTPTALDRWCSRVTLPADPAACWEWTGSRNTDGYGQFSRSSAHRFAYASFVGMLPRGRDWQIDHLCRNRGCVNPDHLELVEQRTNILRGVGFAARNAAKTHCVNGHPFNVANTYRPRHGSARRVCRVCRRAAESRMLAKSTKELASRLTRAGAHEARKR